MTITNTDPVTKRVVRLRDLAAEDEAAAQQEAWAWIVELGHRVHRRRGEALTELAELFATGRPSRTIDGQTEGILVSSTVQPLIDRLFATVTEAWMPWLGKSFDAIHHRGTNTLLMSALLPAKLLWPLYRMVPTRSGMSAFGFETKVEPSALDPDQDVLFIDYASVSGNPRVIIKSIRDELVEIVPGVHLGKVLWTTESNGILLGYFALRKP